SLRQIRRRNSKMIASPVFLHRVESSCLGVALSLVFCCVAAAQDLVAKAKEEKKVVLYHTTTVPDTHKIVDGFHKKYPFLEVETYRATNEKLTQKIVTEVKAGRNLAD